MTNKMTPERALIILDRLNTDERILVDRVELKEAVAVAKAAISRIRPIRAHEIGTLNNPLYECPRCLCGIWITDAYCHRCGQAIKW